MVRSENCFLKVSKINDLGLGEVMLKVRGLVVYTNAIEKNASLHPLRKVGFFMHKSLIF
jgi:hypothetical protein